MKLVVTVEMQLQRQVGGSVLQLCRISYAVQSAFLAIATLLLVFICMPVF